MTMEKQPFEDVSPIKNGDFPANPSHSSRDCNFHHLVTLTPRIEPRHLPTPKAVVGVEASAARVAGLSGVSWKFASGEFFSAAPVCGNDDYYISISNTKREEATDDG